MRRRPASRNDPTGSGFRQVIALAGVFVLGLVLYPVGVEAASSLITLVGPDATSRSQGAQVVDHRLLVALDDPLQVITHVDRPLEVQGAAGGDPIPVEETRAVRVTTAVDNPLDIEATHAIRVTTPVDNPLDIEATHAIRVRTALGAPLDVGVDGPVNVTDSRGPLTVDGNVQSHPALPQTPWWYRARISGAGGSNEKEVLFDAPEASTRLALSSLTITMSGARQQSVDLFIYDQPDCAGERQPLVGPYIEDHSTVQLTFPSPMVVGPYAEPWSLCALAYIPDASSYVEVVGEGFYL